MEEDPIIEEVRQARAAYAARFNYDLEAIYRDLKRQEQASGRTFVVFPLKYITPGDVPTAGLSEDDEGQRLATGGRTRKRA